MLKRILFTLLTVIGACIALGMYSIWVGCPFRRLTGIPCPLCGMTRAVLSALRLDFSLAFNHHPLFFLMPPLGLFLLFHVKKGSRLPKWFFYIIYILTGILFLSVWIWRLMRGNELLFAHTV